MSKYRDLTVGIFFLLVAVVYFLDSLTIQSLGLAGRVGVGPTFLPEVIAVITGLLSVVLIVSSLRTLKNAEAVEAVAEVDTQTEEAGEGQEGVRYMTVILTVVLLLGYALLLDPVGFMPVTFLYLFLQFNVAAPKSSKTMKYQIAYLVAAVLVAVIVNYTFVNLFNVMLPQGILG